MSFWPLLLLQPMSGSSVAAIARSSFDNELLTEVRRVAHRFEDAIALPASCVSTSVRGGERVQELTIFWLIRQMRVYSALEEV
jgi:hypothetical protein